MTIQAQTELSNGEQFRNIIVATRNGRPVRLGDLAVVTDSVQDNQTASWYNGTRAILLGVYRQPEANTVEVVNRVRALLPSFDEQLPRATTLHVLNDRSISIRDAVHDVQLTLLLTIALVIMVIFLFLRRVTATIIPALAVPISLIATLGAMYLLNFSIDNISLLGLTLAVGLVVDDAIVMLENIYRHMEEDGLAPFEAALQGKPRDRLHHHVDHGIAGRRVHSGSADGRHHRPHLQRVRGRRDGGDCCLGVRVVDADTHAGRQDPAQSGERREAGALERAVRARFRRHVARL